MLYVIVGRRQRFHCKELICCERPSIQRFNDLVQSKRIVFEFLLPEKEGKVRNHGYPWRLTSEDVLSELFLLRVKLRKLKWLCSNCLLIANERINKKLLR